MEHFQMEEFENDSFEIYGIGTSEDDEFDSIVGKLQQIVISQQFRDLREAFMEKYSRYFEPADENKLVYTQIFNEYLQTIQQYILRQMGQVRLEDFSNMLHSRQDQIDGPLFEMLLSFSDFSVFKELMIEFRDREDLFVNGNSVIEVVNF